VTGWILIAALVIVALAILDAVPGVNLIVRPVLQGLFKLLGLVFGSLGAWVLWLAKAIWRAHADVINHLTHSRLDIDPRERMEAKNRERN
jgi:multisubunit Na+/H+ antiporter MnhE subunit